eukprot:1182191-Prorocentrum_minimum.AAC.2
MYGLWTTELRKTAGVTRARGSIFESGALCGHDLQIACKQLQRIYRCRHGDDPYNKTEVVLLAAARLVSGHGIVARLIKDHVATCQYEKGSRQCAIHGVHRFVVAVCRGNTND